MFTTIIILFTHIEFRFFFRRVLRTPLKIIPLNNIIHTADIIIFICLFFSITFSSYDKTYIIRVFVNTNYIYRTKLWYSKEFSNPYYRLVFLTSSFRLFNIHDLRKINDACMYIPREVCCRLLIYTFTTSPLSQKKRWTTQNHFLNIRTRNFKHTTHVETVLNIIRIMYVRYGIVSSRSRSIIITLSTKKYAFLICYDSHACTHHWVGVAYIWLF